MTEYNDKQLKEYIMSKVNISTFSQKNIKSTINRIEGTINSVKSNHYGILGAIIGGIAAIVPTILV